MSSFSGYSKSKNNIYGFTDEELYELYKASENKIGNSNGICYYLHIPKTTEEVLNRDFKMDSCVNIANEYFVKNVKQSNQWFTLKNIFFSFQG
jgi:hypothetical protein